MAAMDPKTVPGRKTHLGGMLRIFAKSVQDVTGKHIKKPKSPTLELDAKPEQRLSLSKSAPDIEKVNKKSPEHDSRPKDVLQTRTVSSVPVPEGTKSENHKQISTPAVSQIDLKGHSVKEKENLHQDHSFEDWSSDLMIIESSCKVSTNDFAEQENSSPEAFENVSKTNSKTDVIGIKELPFDKKHEECVSARKNEKERVKSASSETYRKIKKSPKSSTPEHEDKMRSSKKRAKKRLSKKHPMTTDTHRRKSSEKESNVSLSLHKSNVSVQVERQESKCKVPPTDEDWSSDLLDTSSCSSRTSKSETCEVFVTSSEGPKTQKPDNQSGNQLGEGSYSTKRNNSEEYVEVFEAEIESDVLDKTLTKPMGEDWSSDLLSVPSSRNPSPVLTPSFKEDRTDSCDHGKDIECSHTYQNESPHVDLVIDRKVKETCDDPREQRKEGFKLLFSTKPQDKLQERFVDEVSDMTSDQETMSEVESQAPSTVESLQDETICSSDIHANILNQDEDLDYVSSYSQCKPYQMNGSQPRDHCNQSRTSEPSIHSREVQEVKNEVMVSRKNQERRSLHETNNTQICSSTRYPLLHIPVTSIRSKDSAEQLLDFIDSHLQQLGLDDERESQRSIVFSVANDQGQGELQVGLEHQDVPAASYPHSAYWNWACHPWAPYIDSTAYPMCDPRMIQNPYYPCYGDPQKDFPYYYNGSYDGYTQRKMPLDDQEVQQTASSGDPRIVDYDSSSEDERLALLAQRKQQSMENQRYNAEKSYASILTNHSSKRSLQETYSMNSQTNKDKVQRTASGRLQRLGPPKQARYIPGACTDWNKDLVSDGSDMYEASDSENNQNLVKHARSICSQYNTDPSVSQRKAERTETSDREKRRVDPKVWSMRRNRNVIDSDLDESFEIENSNDEKEARSPGCYPYLTIGKMKTQQKENSENEPVIPPLFSAAQWASWATDKESILSHKKEKERRENYKQVQEPAYTSFSTPKRPKPESMERGNVQTSQISSPMTSPQAMPMCPQPFWADPRMGYPFPSCYPPHWMPGIPSGYYRSPPPPPPPPPPPQPSSSPPSTQATTSPQAYSYVVAQYAQARSRTTSAPPIEVEKILKSENTSEEKSCKNYFLGEKNRRVSDSVLRSNAEFAPKRSSYASRLQNDARLNANFPQLDWKIRFKSRCKSYGHKYVDSHCHLDFLFNREGFKGTFAKYMSKHEDTFPENFEGCVAVFCNPATFLPYGGLWKELAKERNVWLTMGCHPKNVTDFDTVAVEGLKRCILHPRIIAVGEIGLDYSGTFRQHEELQKKMFAFQLQLALDVKKPLVIHCRQAEEDCLEIMEKIVPRNYKIHCHCFTGTYEQCKKWLTKFPNLYIGLTNLVSFRSATPTHEVARHIPLSRLLLETDSPYFVPRQVPKGEFDLSHPGMAVFVAEEVARIKGVPVGIVLNQCRSNTLDMYGV